MEENITFIGHFPVIDLFISFFQVLGLYHSLPFPLATDSNVVDVLLELGDSLPWESLTPGCHGNNECTAQSLVARGLPAGKLKGFVAREDNLD